MGDQKEDMSAVLEVATTDLPCFDAVYRAEFGFVWRLFRRLGVPTATIEDACHDLFVVVHRRLADYDPTRPLRPWLAGIAYRVASDFRRRASTRYEIASDPVDIASRSAADLSTLKALEAREARALVRKALEHLDLDKRTVLVLHDLEEVAVPAIAQALEIPLNTAYSRLRLAREQLHRTLRRMVCEEDRT